MLGADSVATRIVQAEGVEAPMVVSAAAASPEAQAGTAQATADAAGGSVDEAVVARARAAAACVEESEEWATEGARMVAALAVLWQGTQARGEGRDRSQSSQRGRTTLRRTTTRTTAFSTRRPRPSSWQSRQGRLRPRLPEG